MCDICRCSPCAPACPNADSDKPMEFCSICNKAIYTGEDAYRLAPNEIWCENCIADLRFTAGEEG